MIFSLVIYTSQTAGQSEQSALRFARNALQQGHTIHRIFFYGNSVTNISNLKITPRDEIDINDQWLEITKNTETDLVVCIAAAVKRGILDQQEAKRHQKSAANLKEGFCLSGLGQLADAIIHSDRVITFGN
jgi:tRNA 2-thiouridine synthesizing protein D